MTALDARTARRRYLVLIGLRWLPTGLLIPVTVLLALSRGLSLTEIGLVFSLQGLVVLALELPTGGLSDSLGRRPVLILASLVGLVSLGLLYVADSVALFAASTAAAGRLPGARQRPLEAWYVDATLAAEPDAEIETGPECGERGPEPRDRHRRAAVRRPRRARSVRGDPDPRPAAPRRARAGRPEPGRDRRADDRDRAWRAASGRSRAPSGPCRASSATASACCAAPRPARARRRRAVLGLLDGHLREPLPGPPFRGHRRHRPGGRPDGPGQLAGVVRRGRRRRPHRGGQPADRRRPFGGRAPDRPGRHDRRDGRAGGTDRGRRSRTSPATSPTAHRTRCTRPCSIARSTARIGRRSCR